MSEVVVAGCAGKRPPHFQQHQHPAPPIGLTRHRLWRFRIITSGGHFPVNIFPAAELPLAKGKLTLRDCHLKCFSFDRWGSLLANSRQLQLSCQFLNFKTKKLILVFFLVCQLSTGDLTSVNRCKSGIQLPTPGRYQVGGLH